MTFLFTKCSGFASDRHIMLYVSYQNIWSALKHWLFSSICPTRHVSHFCSRHSSLTTLAIASAPIPPDRSNPTRSPSVHPLVCPGPSDKGYFHSAHIHTHSYRQLWVDVLTPLLADQSKIEESRGCVFLLALVPWCFVDTYNAVCTTWSLQSETDCKPYFCACGF